MLNTTSLKDPIFVPEMGGPLLVGLISERHWGRQAEPSGSETQTGGDNTEVRGADRRRVGSGGGTQSSFPDRGATVIGPVTRRNQTVPGHFCPASADWGAADVQVGLVFGSPPSWGCPAHFISGLGEGHDSLVHSAAAWLRGQTGLVP